MCLIGLPSKPRLHCLSFHLVNTSDRESLDHTLPPAVQRVVSRGEHPCRRRGAEKGLAGSHHQNLRARRRRPPAAHSRAQLPARPRHAGRHAVELHGLGRDGRGDPDGLLPQLPDEALELSRSRPRARDHAEAHAPGRDVRQQVSRALPEHPRRLKAGVLRGGDEVPRREEVGVAPRLRGGGTAEVTRYAATACFFSQLNVEERRERNGGEENQDAGNGLVGGRGGWAIE